MTSHVVYRAYGPDGQLLYIGMSSSLVQRLLDHAANEKWWAPLVVRVEIERFPSRAAAFEQEARLIDQFQPPHNHCPGHGWSQRDEQIIALRQEGKTRDEIAAALGISYRAAHKAIGRLLATGKIERMSPGYHPPYSRT